MPFKCRVELNKEAGITLRLEDADNSVTQTIVMDGKTVTITVEGEETTTIVQDEKAIAITCKEFTLESEKVALKASDAMNVEATSDLTLKGKNLTGTADSDVAISGNNVTAEGKQALELSGTNVKIEGKVELAFAGAMSKVESKGMLDLKANGMTTVDSAMSKLGKMIKMG